MTDIEHFCELPDANAPGMRGRSHQCPECHAEWMVTRDHSTDRNIWMMRLTAEQAAQQVEDLMHELAHEDIDPAVIRAHVQNASFAVQQIVKVVGERHGEAAAIVIRKSWNAFVRSVQPYFLDRPCDHHTFMEGRDASPTADG